MGRKGRYETHVRPNLDEIRKWIETCSEKQICKKLGITERSFGRYKKEHEELREALLQGKQSLVEDLKQDLKKKARGFYYTETKTVVQKKDGVKTVMKEEYERYAQPDTGAIHLLLKNLDPEWRNDDQTTIDLKRQKLELDKQKADDNNW